MRDVWLLPVVTRIKILPNYAGTCPSLLSIAQVETDTHSSRLLSFLYLSPRPAKLQVPPITINKIHDSSHLTPFNHDVDVKQSSNTTRPINHHFRLRWRISSRSQAWTGSIDLLASFFVFLSCSLPRVGSATGNVCHLNSARQRNNS